MASNSYPRPGYNGGFVSEVEHEKLMLVAHADGVLGHPASGGPVFADNALVRTVKISDNQVAWVRGSRWESGSATITLPQLAANTSGFPRIDRVVLRLDRSDYTVKETVITGTPAATPIPPAMQASTGTTGLYDFPLADVLVNTGATNIQGSAVTHRCWFLGADGQIRCTTNSYPPLEAGRAVWLHPEGRYQVSTGDVWRTTAEDSGPVALEMMSGYASSQNTVWRRNGWVFAQLTFTRTPTGMNGGVPYTVAMLPDGFHPPFDYQTNAQCPTEQVTCTVAVLATGEIRVNPGADVTVNRSVVLDAMCHPAA